MSAKRDRKGEVRWGAPRGESRAPRATCRLAAVRVERRASFAARPLSRPFPPVLFAILLAILFAERSPHPAGRAGSPPVPNHEATTIRWDRATLVLIQEGGSYGRMARASNGDILCAYARLGNIEVRRSGDNGKSWGEPVRATDYPCGAATNPELLPLADGRILLAYNERPRDGKHPFAIAICATLDRGVSWGRHRRLYVADTQWGNGCWEPALIQLPSGEIQLYFANENPYRSSNEQEITRLKSRDGGRTWGPPETASFRAGHRDGMPVPLVLRDGGGIVVAIEDNGLAGRFKPAVIDMSAREGERQPPVGGDSPRRWSALRDPLPTDVYAGAPYLRQLPNGLTILSVQSAEGRKPSTTLEHSRMVVFVGDASARDFANPTEPFPVASADRGLWNSLFVKNATTVTAISSAVIRGVRGLWAIDGRVVSAP